VEYGFYGIAVCLEVVTSTLGCGFESSYLSDDRGVIAVDGWSDLLKCGN
jgi:hypothetical protein